MFTELVTTLRIKWGVHAQIPSFFVHRHRSQKDVLRPTDARNPPPHQNPLIMLLASLFRATAQPVQITSPKPSLPVQIGQAPPGPTSQQSAPIHTNLDQSAPISTEMAFPARAWLFPSQLRWPQDQSILRLWEKSRQIGATKTDALDSVLKASPPKPGSTFGSPPVTRPRPNCRPAVGPQAIKPLASSNHPSNRTRPPG